MFKRSWEVQPGMGEAILTGLGNDVHMRKRLGPSTPRLILLGDVHEQTADILIAERLREVATVEDDISLEALTRRFTRAEQTQLAKARAMRSLIERVEELEGREYLGNDHIWRVRINPLESGVVGWKATGGGGNSGEGEMQMLKAGKVKEGMSGVVGSITSVPELGGELVMDFEGEDRLLPRRKGIHVTGLVSPETGDPQVDLQILAKKQ
jgi:hypothetical protein